MNLPLELFIGLRYIRARRRNHFVSFISLVSMLGLGLGVMALIIVISVMNGFEKEFSARLIGMVSHVTISSPNSSIKDWRALSKNLKDNASIIGSAPYVEAEGMLANLSSVSGVLVRGIDPDIEPQVSEIHRHMVFGKLTDLIPGEYGIVLGTHLANSLDVDPGATITMITPQVTSLSAGFQPLLRRFKVVGLFEIGDLKHDRGSAIIHVKDASRLFRLDGGVTGLRLKLNNLDSAPLVTRQLKKEVSSDYWVSDWTKRYGGLFKAIQTEKTTMFVILALIVAVAAFNIVSTLVIMVADKQSDIAILRTIGMSPSSVMCVFMIQGTVIGLFGTLLGLGSGVLITAYIDVIIPALEQFFQTQFLPESNFPLSEVPADMKISDVVKISGLSFLVSVIATLYPAFTAAKTRPVDALSFD